MWIPKRLVIKNIRSYVNQEFIIENGKTIIVCGINYDDEGQESNGSGKSVPNECKAYALTGSALSSKVLDSELIRNGEKEGYILFELFNTRFSQKLVIERNLFTKGSSKLKITLNNEDQCDKFSTVPEGNKYLLELIGINKNDILNYYIVSKEKYVSFYSSSDTDKKEVISRFSKANIIDGVDGLVDTKLAGFQTEITKINDNITSKEGELKVHEENLQKEKDTNFEQSKIERISVLNQFVIQLEQDNVEYEKRILKGQSIIKIVENHKIRYSKIKNIYASQIATYKEQKKVQDDKLTELGKKENEISEREKQLIEERGKVQIQLNEATETLNHIELLINGAIECPKCNHKFLISEDLDLETAKELLPDAKSVVDDFTKSLNDIKDKIAKIPNEYKVISQDKDKVRLESNKIAGWISNTEKKQSRCISGISNIDKDILDYNKGITQINKLIQAGKQSIEGHKKEIEIIKGQKVNPKIAELEVTINEISISIEEEKKKLEEKKQEQVKHEQWLYYFQKFKSHLANKSIKVIEQLTNGVLNKMKSNLRIELEGYTMLKNKQIREKITPTILRNGMIEGNFFKFSGGEKGRIEIATIIALQHLINLQSESGGLDLLSVDEVLESVDGLGMISIMKSCENLHSTIRLVTHVDLSKFVNSNVLTIVKQNGESKISA